MLNKGNQSQDIAEALEPPLVVNSTTTLVVDHLTLVAHRILSNLVKVSPFWSTCSEQAATEENGGLSCAS